MKYDWLWNWTPIYGIAQDDHIMPIVPSTKCYYYDYFYTFDHTHRHKKQNRMNKKTLIFNTFSETILPINQKKYPVITFLLGKLKNKTVHPNTIKCRKTTTLKTEWRCNWYTIFYLPMILRQEKTYNKQSKREAFKKQNRVECVKKRIEKHVLTLIKKTILLLLVCER